MSPAAEDRYNEDLDAATITAERVRDRAPHLVLPADETPEVLNLRPGTLVKHYELIRPIGAGGMGTVFLGRDTRLGRLVAIKLLSKYTGAATHRFLAEARTTAQCRHENIVVIYDVDEYDGYPYMVLEYIEGRTLRAVMAERGAGSAALAAEAMLPVARALVRAHEMGIVHRDLKPENILLSNDGQIKVLDFGVAKQLTEALPETIETSADSSFGTGGAEETQQGSIVGTLAYMAPEQILGDVIDARTDIWAVGIILYEMVAGQHPLGGVSLAHLVGLVNTDDEMPSLRQTCPGVGRLADIVDRCLRKNKNERFGSAKDLARALERLGAESTPSVIGEDESPFAGLSAFQESDAPRFFGRDSDIAAVMTRLRHHELVAIAGPSGAGKSSFVRAGIFPALKRAGKSVEAFAIRPGRRPQAALADVLAFFADTETESVTAEDSDPEAIVRLLRSQPGHLGAKLRARCRKRGPDHTIILFVDQFEELYTLGTEAAERAAFCACLEGVADEASSPLRVIITIRADFLDRLTDDRRFLASVSRGLVFLPPIGRAGLADALKKPLESVGYAFEDDALVDEMLDGLVGTKCPLPLLQFTASKVWDARDQERRLLTRDAYMRLGGVAGALSTHADAVIAGLSAPEQRLARALFLRLVTVERTRAIVSLDELQTLHEQPKAVEQVITHLADARLLTIETGGEQEEKTVELTHESLIERWGKLKQWLDDNQQHAQFLAELRNASQQWEKNGEADGWLWRDDAAIEAGQWLARRRMENGAHGTLDLGQREVRYLEAVVRFAERTRRWKLRIVVALGVAVSAVAMSVSVLALRARDQASRADAQAKRADEQAKRADERADAAEAAARQARNATRMAAARGQEADPTTTLALLRELEPGPLPPGWDTLIRTSRAAGVTEVVLEHMGSVGAAAYSPDSKHIATASVDRIVRVWNADGTGTPLLFRGHEARAYGVSWSPDGRRIASTAHDKTVRVWNADGTGEPLVFHLPDSAVPIAWSPDGRRLAAGSFDKTLRVWNVDGTGEPLVLRGHEALLDSVTFSPDGKHIATASEDGTVRVWNADGSGNPLVLKGHQGAVFCAMYSPDGNRIVSASGDDHAVRVWNADGKGEPLVLRGHQDWVTAAAFTPDGRRIVSSSKDGTVTIWQADGEGKPSVLRGHSGRASDMTLSPDGHHAVTASTDGTVRIWRIDGTDRPIVLQGHEDIVTTAVFSPDGKHILSASFDKTARVWSADGQGRPLILRGHTHKVASASYSPDGKHVVTASMDTTMRIYDADGSGQPVVLRGHTDTVGGGFFSPDGKRIVSASSDKTVRIWNADGVGEPLVLRGHEDVVHSASFSPDGLHILSASRDKTLRIWNADGKGEPIVVLGHDDAVLGAGYSPDGSLFASASRDRTVRLWSAERATPISVFHGHDAAANVREYGAFSPDGARLVSASDDGTVRIWRVDGKDEPILIRLLLAKTVSMASWSPDGQRIVAATEGNSAIILRDLEPYRDASDPRLWAATSYCMPLEIRKRLLGFSEEQSRSDLERCQAYVNEARRSMLP